ncbi:sn-glycerol-3-phosphate-binding periplasmic protein UgpB [Methylobacterium hispanicum]|uniref:sn-glycerol-3-phosphate-binding periplasmic protein UgpB n=1 Tax=Methylobacterium hispanicum TaxID=270350 RepID=A0AAV4ZRC6_9HYPH|nr:extracellular solute-binding protein [Methylobacterium hispanicum]GJD90631.1 sn-glycerol-3-phosphate-binding periplasmic protein UgpB [Methylobacterium hispanicum]
MRTLYLLAALIASSPAAGQTRIDVWHALSGPPRVALEAAAAAFNRAEPEYVVQPTAMQQSSAVLSKIGAELRLMRPQHAVLAVVSETASGEMAGTSGLAYPVSDLLRDMAESYDPNAFMPAVRASFSDASGSLLALPFLLTTPVLYYDAKAVQGAGFDPSRDLRTWNGLEKVAAKLSADRGGACAFAMQAPTWIAVENLMAMHDRPVASFDNGRGGPDARLAVDLALAARQLARLVDMARSGAYRPRTGGVEPVGAFLGRACPMLLGTSGLLGHIRGRAPFDVGVLPVPFLDDVINPPKPSLPGGFAVWALRGRTPAENKGAAKFVAFLASPEAQAWLAREIGSIPSTFEGWRRAQVEGATASEPGLAVAAAELAGQLPTAASRSPRLRGKAEIGEYFDAAFDHAFQGVRQPHAALSDAMARADGLLREKASAER